MISIIGPGGVGGLLAGLLIAAGIDTTVVARPKTADWLNRDGLTIESDRYGAFQVPVRAQTSVPPGSSVLVAVKSYGLPEVLPLIAAAQPAAVLTVLNGVSHAPLVHQALDPVAPTVCGTVRVVTIRRLDRVIRHTSPYAEVALPDAARDWELGRALESAGVEVLRGGAETTVMWRKFHFLIGMALLTAWADEPMGPALDRDPELTREFGAEVAALATLEGFPVAPEALLAKLRAVDPAATSSFRTDVRAGGPTEIDALGFDLLRRAAGHGLAVPNLTRVVTEIADRLGVSAS